MKLNNIAHYVNGYIASKKFTAPPVIIGGCERSGTSLFQSIVSAHPDIFAIDDETWTFCYGPAAGFKGNKPIRITRLYKALGSREVPHGRARWSEKSPANVFYFDSILKYFSNNVRLINIIRDGRDVVSSMHPDDSSRPWVSIDRWVEAMEEGYRYKDNSQVLTIKYEDLITNYNATIELVCKHIGVDFNGQILDWHQNATIKNNKNLIGEKVKKLSNKSINKFLSRDFKHKHIIDDFMKNERAVHFLKVYNYL